MKQWKNYDSAGVTGGFFRPGYPSAMVAAWLMAAGSPGMIPMLDC
jgi:hypothetical protein